MIYIASFSKNEAELDFLLQRINEVCTRWGLKVSIAKTNILVIAGGERPPDPRVSLNGEEIKVVEHAKYLGSWYSNNGSIEKEINVRVGAAWGAGRKLGPILRAKKVSIKSKVHMYQSLVLPILTYGAESWPLTTALTAKLEHYHQCQLRAILGLSWRDMVSNKEVHERLKTVSMEECCRRQRMLWMGHVVRMPDNRLPKILLFGQMEGHRIRGRKLSLRRLYEKDIMELKGGFPDGLDWYELASDRKIWPKFVMREPLAQQPATESNGLQTTNGLQTASAAAVDANTHADGNVHPVSQPPSTAPLRRSSRIIERMGQSLSTPLNAPLTSSSGQPRRSNPSSPYIGRPRGRPRGSGRGTGAYMPTGNSRGRPVGSKSKRHGF
ncbi:putative uncharacterized transposon-derived protein F52C9.6 [Nannochloris sp. 'desiccata']|nr:hypothetical protein KSW81_006035 [Chlorella desiccata (nom. nud.)]KAH7621161.1 putative uncharacterized transposon-derived protein F52C9.6 [Chlorella desiccata (nom. nud.)]